MFGLVRGRPWNPVERNLAVLIDFDNIAKGCRQEGLGEFDIRIVMRRLKDKGRILVARAYTDWERWSRHRKVLAEQGVTMIELTSTGHGDKNRGDIALVCDAMEIAYTRDYIDTFVILSGDSDFTPLVQRLKELNKSVIGIGTRGSTSRLIANVCDEFTFYDNIVREIHRPPPRQHEEADEDDDEMDREEAWKLLVETVENHMRDDGAAVGSGMLKSSMKRKAPTFSETELGFRSFARFLEKAQQRGIINLTRDERGGGYRVESTGNAGEEEPRRPREHRNGERPERPTDRGDRSMDRGDRGGDRHDRGDRPPDRPDRADRAHDRNDRPTERPQDRPHERTERPSDRAQDRRNDGPHDRHFERPNDRHDRPSDAPDDASDYASDGEDDAIELDIAAMSAESRRLLERLAENGFDIGSSDARRRIAEALVGLSNERAEKNRKCAVQFVQGDIIRRGVGVPPRRVRAVCNAFLRAGALMHKDGTPVRSPTAPFVPPEDADTLLEALDVRCLAVFSQLGEAPGRAELGEIFMGTVPPPPPVSPERAEAETDTVLASAPGEAAPVGDTLVPTEVVNAAETQEEGVDGAPRARNRRGGRRGKKIDEPTTP